jgi:anti-sigma regulatory factor (Ser/Thr protein kinase)
VTPCVRSRLAADKWAVREARLRVRELRALQDLPAQVAADAELVVSELVVNSLLHAHLEPGDVIDLALVCDGERLVIEVDDHGSFSGPPRGRRGMGVRVLDALCEDWQAQAGQVRASLRIGAGGGALAPAPAAAAGRRGAPRSTSPHRLRHG